MKTIEEAAKECSFKIAEGLAPYMTIGHISIENSFKAGVEFAQRWIPVEEEMPKKEQMIIAKYSVDSKKCVLVDLYGDIDINFVKQCFEVWRPIEFK